VVRKRKRWQRVSGDQDTTRHGLTFADTHSSLLAGTALAGFLAQRGRGSMALRSSSRGEVLMVLAGQGDCVAL
jgi:hypothetical protein